MRTISAVLIFSTIFTTCLAWSQTAPLEVGMTMPFDWRPDHPSYRKESVDALRVNYQRYLHNLDRLKGKMDWVRIHAWSWLILDPQQFNADGSPVNSNNLLNNPTFWKEGVAILKEAIREAQARGFKVQIASAEVDHRVGNYQKVPGQYFYNIQQLQTHYQKVVRHMASEFRTAESWALFNESNQFNFRNGKWNGNLIDEVPNYLEDMVSLLAVARQEIKALNPNTIVVCSNYIAWEMFNNPFQSQQNQRRLKMYYDKTYPYVDMVALNFYVSDQAHLPDMSKIDFELTQLQRHVSFLRKYYPKPIFIAEFGIPVCRGATDAQQATWLDALLRKMQALKISKIMLYTMQDDSQYNLGTNACEYNFGYTNLNGQDRVAFSRIIEGTVQDIRRPASVEEGTDYFCQATKDARLGSANGNLVPTKVTSKEACFQHCRQNVRVEDRDHWLKDGWNMCWFDDRQTRGFIFTGGSGTDEVVGDEPYTPVAPDEIYLCQATRNSSLGSSASNNVVKSVRSPAHCLSHCAATIRSEDQNHWQKDKWNMCWYDDGKTSKFIFGQPEVIEPSTPVVKNQLCLAVRNATLSSPSNEVELMVGQRSECLQHCRNTIRAEDQNGWQKNGWNMCWYDDNQTRGFIK